MDEQLDVDSFESKPQPFLFENTNWQQLMLPQNMPTGNGMSESDSHSHSTAVSTASPTASSPLDVRTAVSSPLSHIQTSGFAHGMTTSEPSSSSPEGMAATSGSLSMTPPVASSMATLNLTAFGNAMTTADTTSRQDGMSPGIIEGCSTADPAMALFQSYQPAFDASSTMLTSSQMPFAIPIMSNQQSYGSAQSTLDGITFTGNFDLPLHSSPTEEYISTTQGQMHVGLDSLLVSAAMDPLTSGMGSLSGPDATFPYSDFNFVNPTWPHFVGDMNSTQFPTSNIGNTSPEQQTLEPRSLSSIGSDSWSLMDYPPSSRNSFGSFSEVVHPPTLHIRSPSGSSHHSDNPPFSARSSGSGDEIFTISPEPEPIGDLSHPLDFNMTSEIEQKFPSPQSISSTRATAGRSVNVPSASHSPVESVSSSPSSTTSPKSRRRQSPTGASAGITKKKSTGSAANKDKPEKRIGRRRGPLRPEQRQQAHEIRKLRACLRCKFLKKVCDKGDPCGGCQPAHARLWQVPCTRIDIKDIAYFLKDWTIDYKRHVTLDFSVTNIKGFANEERTLYITHGYGFIMPIRAREVFVHDESCFGIDWCEGYDPNEDIKPFQVQTARLSAGIEGISRRMVSEYLDMHLDQGFDHFVNDYFAGTPFLTELLKTIHRYYLMTNMPVIRKGLKLVLAYCLTQHITLVDNLPEEEAAQSRIEDPNSHFYGRVCSPVMINFQVKKAMADMWRELMKDVLEELSALYSSVYNGEKFKNWPTIFILAALILSVWEFMQFDSHYRVPEEGVASKFCNEMETVPVGVIVGLFSAISTKLPNLLEWDSTKHGSVWNGNPAVCDTMTDVRSHVEKHESYLRTRNEAKFDRDEFDCLSNKFLSKLVIRAN